MDPFTFTAPVELTANWPYRHFQTAEAVSSKPSDSKYDFDSFIDMTIFELTVPSLVQSRLGSTDFYDKYGQINGFSSVKDITADGAKDVLRNAKIEDFFRIVPSTTVREVQARSRLSGGFYPFVYNLIPQNGIYFESIDDVEVPVTEAMITAAYPTGESPAKSSTSGNGYLLLFDRLEFEASVTYGGIPYEITIPFNQNNMNARSFSLRTAEPLLAYDFFDPDLNPNCLDFYLNQFEGDVAMQAVVSHPDETGRNIETAVDLELPADTLREASRAYFGTWLSESFEEEGHYLDLYFTEGLTVEYLTVLDVQAPVLFHTGVRYHMPDVTVEDVGSFLDNPILMDRCTYATVDLLYEGGRSLSVDKEDVENYIGGDLPEDPLWNEGLYERLWRELKDRTAGDYSIPFDGEIISYTFVGTMKEVISYAVFDEDIETEVTKYICEEYTAPDVEVIEYYFDTPSAFIGHRPSEEIDADAKQRTVPLPQGFFDELTTEKPKHIELTLADKDMRSPERCDSFTFTVENDDIESLTFEIDPLYSTIIVGEPIDLRDSFVTAHYAHGQSLKKPLTLDMLGDYTEETGEQEIPVRFSDGTNEFTDTVTMTVRKLKSIEKIIGLDDHYLKDEEPDCGDVYISVIYTNDEKDVIPFPADRIPAIDTATVGSSDLTLTYGGVSKAFSYRVIEGLYLTYTSGDHVAFTGCEIGKPAADAENVFVPEDIKNIVLPAEIDGVAVTELKANLFANLSVLRSLVVPDSVTTVGYGAVDNCKNLRTLTIPTTVPIEHYFKEYTKKDMFSNGTNPTLPDDLTIVFSDSVTELSADFLANFESANDISFKLDLGAGIEEIVFSGEEPSFPNWGYIQGFAATGNPAFTVKGNVLFADDGATLFYYPDFKTETSYTVPAGVTAILYMENKNLTELVISKDVATLPDDFMSSCDKLLSVTFEADSSLRVLPDDAFRSCSSLETFVFPDHLEEIGAYALTYINVEKIILPSTVTTIGDHAFDNATCTHFYLPTSATDSCMIPTTYYSNGIHLPKLQAFAYDGSIALSSLVFFIERDVYNAGFALYITGEDKEIDGYTWCGGSSIGNVFAGSATPLRSVYVFGGVSFNRHTLPNTVTVTDPADDAEKWW